MRGGAAPTHPKDISSTPPGVYIQQKYIETYGFGVDSMYITLKKCLASFSIIWSQHVCLTYIWFWNTCRMLGL